MPLPASFLPVLHQIHAALHGQDILWAITGSTSFALRGLPFTPKDIDLQTDKDGAYALEAVLRDFVVQPVAFSGTDRIRSHFGKLLVDSVPVEIMGDMQKFVDGSLDGIGTGRWQPPPDLAQHREFIQFDGLELPVLSLAYERDAYEKMGRVETAARLQQWLENQEEPDGW